MHRTAGRCMHRPADPHMWRVEAGPHAALPSVPHAARTTPPLALSRRADDPKIADRTGRPRGSRVKALAHDALADLHDGRPHALLVGLARQSPAEVVEHVVVGP